MARYIDREKVESVLYGITAYKNTIPLDSAIFNIRKVETADVVEVVRCKDCVLRWTACPMVVRFMDANGGLRLSFFTTDDDFCSRGKK